MFIKNIDVKNTLTKRRSPVHIYKKEIYMYQLTVLEKILQRERERKKREIYMYQSTVLEKILQREKEKKEKYTFTNRPS